jgi:hypothetical protein
MRTDFGYVFWGLILTVLDFKINQFDLLPDFIGYALVAFGAAGLSKLSPEFLTACGLSVMLAMCDLISLVIPTDLDWFGIVVTLLSAMMMWMLLGGVRAIALQRERHDLAARAEKLRLWYVGLMLLSMALTLIVRETRGDGTFFIVVALVVAALTVMILILLLIYRARNELSVDGGG